MGKTVLVIAAVLLSLVGCNPTNDRWTRDKRLPDTTIRDRAKSINPVLVRSFEATFQFSSGQLNAAGLRHGDPAHLPSSNRPENPQELSPPNLIEALKVASRSREYPNEPPGGEGRSSDNFTFHTRAGDVSFEIYPDELDALGPEVADAYFRLRAMAFRNKRQLAWLNKVLPEPPRKTLRLMPPANNNSIASSSPHWSPNELWIDRARLIDLRKIRKVVFDFSASAAQFSRSPRYVSTSSPAEILAIRNVLVHSQTLSPGYETDWHGPHDSIWLQTPDSFDDGDGGNPDDGFHFNLQPQDAWTEGPAFERIYWKYWKRAFPRIRPVNFLEGTLPSMKARSGRRQNDELAHEDKLVSDDFKENPDDQELRKEFVLVTDRLADYVMFSHEWPAVQRYPLAAELLRRSLAADSKDEFARALLNNASTYKLQRQVSIAYRDH